jgi:hypothetical protein
MEDDINYVKQMFKYRQKGRKDVGRYLEETNRSIAEGWTWNSSMDLIRDTEN